MAGNGLVQPPFPCTLPDAQISAHGGTCLRRPADALESQAGGNGGCTLLCACEDCFLILVCCAEALRPLIGCFFRPAAMFNFLIQKTLQ